MATDYKVSQDVSLEDWIDGVSYLQAEHTIYRNPALVAQYQPLMNKIAALEAERERLLGPRSISRSREQSLGDEAKEKSSALDQSLGEGNPLISEIHQGLEDLYAQAEALWEQYSSDVEVWTLRRLDESEAAAILKEIGGIEDPPPAPAPDATQEEKDAQAQALAEWYNVSQQRNHELNLRCLAKSVLSVKVRGQEVPVPDRAALDRIGARPGGARHLRELINALETLTGEGPAITAPHRPGA